MGTETTYKPINSQIDGANQCNASYYANRNPKSKHARNLWQEVQFLQLEKYKEGPTYTVLLMYDKTINQKIFLKLTQATTIHHTYMMTI